MTKNGTLREQEDEEIKELWNAVLAPPEDAGASALARYCIHVGRLISKRSAAESGHGFSVFLLSETLQNDIQRLNKVRVPLLSNGNDNIADAAWVVTPTIADAYKLEIGCLDQDQLFLDIGASGLNEFPTIVVDWRSGAPIAHLYPKGIACPDERRALIVEERPITEGELKAALDRFFDISLRTPAAAAENRVKIWKKAAIGQPEERPEGRIQGRAVDFLRGQFPLRGLRQEPVSEDGRADITMFAKVYSSGGHSALRYDWVLELKALCDRTSTGNPVPKKKIREAIKSGLEQVALYRENHNASRCALCCYDMRENDEGDGQSFKEISATAKNTNTPLWRWYLYRSMQKAREAKVAKA